MALRPAPYNPEDHPYPKMVYPGAPKPGTGTLVKNKAEHDALLAKQAPASADDADTDDKDALLTTALGLGIEADKRWGVQKLKDAIAEAQKPTASE